MYRITYKNLESGKYKSVVDQDESTYEKRLLLAVILESSGVIRIEAAGELKEIKDKEENQC